MNSKSLKKSTLFLSLILISSVLFFSFQIKDKSINTKENTTYPTANNDKSIHPIAKYQIKNIIAKCGGDSKSATKKSKCGTGKCGEGKCGSGKAMSSKPNILDSDTNGDGKVTLSEFSTHSSAEFPLKDKNNDGKLSKDECGMFDKFNSDGNEFVSKTEFTKGHIALFKKLDKNKDGFVDANEAKEFKKCGTGKCAEGKCGGDKSNKKSKCGAGKCGNGK